MFVLHSPPERSSLLVLGKPLHIVFGGHRGVCHPPHVRHHPKGRMPSAAPPLVLTHSPPWLVVQWAHNPPWWLALVLLVKLTASTTNDARQCWQFFPEDPTPSFGLRIIIFHESWLASRPDLQLRSGPRARSEGGVYPLCPSGAFLATFCQSVPFWIDLDHLFNRGIIKQRYDRTAHKSGCNYCSV